MQHPANDYINWLRQQEGLLGIEEAQLLAEEQWLQQKEWEHEQGKGAAIAQIILLSFAKVRTQTSYERQKQWLRQKRGEFEQKRITLQARRAWLQAQKKLHGIP